MAITNGYATLAEVKAYLRVTSTDAGDDAVIEDLVESVSRRIDAECNRHFYQVTEARYFQAHELDILDVDDIATITGLEIKSQLNSDGTYQYTWASTDYNMRPYSPRMGFPYTAIETSEFGTNSFDREKRGNKITATWGWSAIPDDIKTVCLNEVANEYHRRFGENPNGTATVTAAGVVITPQGWSKVSVQTLQRYRRLIA